MSDELEYSLKKLQDALTKLEEGVGQAKDELGRDGVIQRFEFTFELAWKTIKIFLKDKGIEVKSPKDSFVEAFQIGWIKDEQAFLMMLDDRNETSHVYSKDKAEAIFKRIKEAHLVSIQTLFKTLKSSI
jgi:nucleotidyltransferase substrate binding protein (TIGR01987 family)